MDTRAFDFLEKVKAHADIMREQSRPGKRRLNFFQKLFYYGLDILCAIHRHCKLHGLTLPNKPTDKHITTDNFCISQSTKQPRLYEIKISGYPLPKRIEELSEWEDACTLQRISSKSRGLLVIHAYYEKEAEQIFELAKSLRNIDIVMTTSVPELIDKFFDMVPQAHACLLCPNIGRDILPFLMACRFLSIDSYEYFIKLHTKRSSHANDGGAWFYESLHSLIGNPEITEIMAERLPKESPSIYGCSTMPLQDHYVNNRFWMEHLIGAPYKDASAEFVPGTMFMGNGAFLRATDKRNLWHEVFEDECGQLDGCLAHALERMFGYIAHAHGGEYAGRCKLLSASEDKHETHHIA